MGAVVFLILLVIGVIVGMSAIIKAVLKKHPQFQKPRVVLWMLLGVGIGFLGLSLVHLLFEDALLAWTTLLIGIFCLALGTIFTVLGANKALKSFIAIASFFFGFSIWFILWGILSIGYYL